MSSRDDQFFFMDGRKMLTGAQMRAARALIRWTVEDLAKTANVGVMTVRRAEANDGAPSMMANNLAAIRAALESAGVEFIPENGGGPGVRLKKKSIDSPS
ncbi:transcriptional regulator [Methylocystis sp. JAN1]|uniref:transcriptional regulator n=1 Tax=Methylocystis sp. JAN1 TaxID=3397211 RepID=UPI003FA2DA80